MCRPISHSVLPRTKFAPFGNGSISSLSIHRSGGNESILILKWVSVNGRQSRAARICSGIGGNGDRSPLVTAAAHALVCVCERGAVDRSCHHLASLSPRHAFTGQYCRDWK